LTIKIGCFRVEVLWAATRCSVVVRYQRFWGPYCLHLRLLSYHNTTQHNTTRRHNPEEVNLNLHRRRNPKTLIKTGRRCEAKRWVQIYDSVCFCFVFYTNTTL